MFDYDTDYLRDYDYATYDKTYDDVMAEIADTLKEYEFDMDYYRDYSGLLD